MAASVWKGSITFGLVSVPVKLFAAARYSHISFHEVHRECGHRVQQQLYCPYDKRVVSRDEIVMGYETDDDKMVIVDREELKKLQPASSSSMEILQFVKLERRGPYLFRDFLFFRAGGSGAPRLYAVDGHHGRAAGGGHRATDHAPARAHGDRAALPRGLDSAYFVLSERDSGCRGIWQK